MAEEWDIITCTKVVCLEIRDQGQEQLALKRWKKFMCVCLLNHSTHSKPK